MSKGERIRNERVSFQFFILQCLKEPLFNATKIVTFVEENKNN